MSQRFQILCRFCSSTHVATSLADATKQAADCRENGCAEQLQFGASLLRGEKPKQKKELVRA